MSLVLGVDYGTDSVRVIIINTETGTTLAQAVENYPRWAKGMYCNPAKSQFRQHPLDYTESLIRAAAAVLAQCPPETGQKIAGISIDTTGSTPVLVDKTGTPLSISKEHREFHDDPDGMFILWKDHTSIREAEDINAASAQWKGKSPITYVGGIYSSEWFWAKALRVFRTNPNLGEATTSVVEHCDWITAELTGTTHPQSIKRSRCAAGHKALWHRDFGGYPGEEFFQNLHPGLGPIVRSLGTQTYTSDVPAGTITPYWAKQLGINPGCIVGVGAFDAHMGAVGAGIGKNQLAKVIGTSTCDILIAPPKGEDPVVAGICGQVDGSVVPGTIGYEAGQSAFGDVYAWFRNLLLWPLEQLAASQKNSENKAQEESPASGIPAEILELVRERLADNILPWLSRAAELVDPAESGILALDWFNGRRTPDADQNLKGALTGLHLGTDAPRIFRALVESTAFGAKAIVQRFAEQGVPIESVIALGGISQKSPLVMQILADVLGVPISVSAAEQACALGAAMFASVASGCHENLASAQKTMGAGFSQVYSPRPEMVRVYETLYKHYQALGKFEEKASQERKLVSSSTKSTNHKNIQNQQPQMEKKEQHNE